MVACHNQATSFLRCYTRIPSKGKGEKRFTGSCYPLSRVGFWQDQTQKNKQLLSWDLVLEVFLQQYCLPLRCDAQRKPLPESPGRHFALPVAYLSKVTHHLSRCLKKTPASAFTPILHDHISFPRPLRLLFHFLLRCRYRKVKMACCLFIYESCFRDMCLCIF